MRAPFPQSVVKPSIPMLVALRLCEKVGAFERGSKAWRAMLEDFVSSGH